MFIPRQEQPWSASKEEVADEMGLLDKANSIGWDNMTTKEAGLSWRRNGPPPD